jgi:hypothetical protein
MKKLMRPVPVGFASGASGVVSTQFDLCSHGARRDTLGLENDPSWRDLPEEEFGPWQTIYGRYRKWR